MTFKMSKLFLEFSISMFKTTEVRFLFLFQELKMFEEKWTYNVSKNLVHTWWTEVGKVSWEIVSVRQYEPKVFKFSVHEYPANTCLLSKLHHSNLIETVIVVSFSKVQYLYSTFKIKKSFFSPNTLNSSLQVYLLFKFVAFFSRKKNSFLYCIQLPTALDFKFYWPIRKKVEKSDGLKSN